MGKLIIVRRDLKHRLSPANGTHERNPSRMKWQKQLSLKTKIHGILESWKNQAGKDHLILMIFSHTGDCLTSDPSHGGKVSSRNLSECCAESTWTLLIIFCETFLNNQSFPKPTGQSMRSKKQPGSCLLKQIPNISSPPLTETFLPCS